MNLTEYDQRLKKKLYMEHDDDNMSNKKKKIKPRLRRRHSLGEQTNL